MLRNVIPKIVRGSVQVLCIERNANPQPVALDASICIMLSDGRSTRCGTKARRG